MRILLGILLVSFLLPPGLARAEDTPRQIIVTGEGVVSVEPDMATVFVGVAQEARLARDALAGASESGSAVLAKLEDLGVEARDIQTRSIGLNPQYARVNDGSVPRVTGYVASLDLTVRVRDFDQLGVILDVLVADGANRMNGLSFGVADRSGFEQEARGAAVRDARARAETLAEAAGVTLGAVQSISEGGGGPMPFAADRGMMMEARAAVPIAGGEIDIRSTVTMVFAISD